MDGQQSLIVAILYLYTLLLLAIKFLGVENYITNKEFLCILQRRIFIYKMHSIY